MNPDLFLPTLVVAAFLDSLNPCAISVLLITIGFLVQLGFKARKVFITGFAYILGIYLSYLLIGIGILKTLNLFLFSNLIPIIAAGLFLAWGILEIVRVRFENINSFFLIPQFTHKSFATLIQKGTLPAVFLTGVLVALFEFPCTGGPYLSILVLLGEKETFLQGFGYLLLYNLIFVSPLFVIIFVAGNNLVINKIQNFRKAHFKQFRLISGIIFILLGTMLLGTLLI